MNLPTTITELIKVQNNHDSISYADCFAPTAVVLDEGKTYVGKAEITQWIADANHKYKTLIKPVSYTETGISSILTAEISGTFDGSPLLLNYHFELIDGLIQSLKVTG